MPYPGPGRSSSRPVGGARSRRWSWRTRRRSFGRSPFLPPAAFPVGSRPPRRAPRPGPKSTSTFQGRRRSLDSAVSRAPTSRSPSPTMVRGGGAPRDGPVSVPPGSRSPPRPRPPRRGTTTISGPGRGSSSGRASFPPTGSPGPPPRSSGASRAPDAFGCDITTAPTSRSAFSRTPRSSRTERSVAATGFRSAFGPASPQGSSPFPWPATRATERGSRTGPSTTGSPILPCARASTLSSFGVGFAASPSSGAGKRSGGRTRGAAAAGTCSVR